AGRRVEDQKVVAVAAGGEDPGAVRRGVHLALRLGDRDARGDLAGARVHHRDLAGVGVADVDELVRRAGAVDVAGAVGAAVAAGVAPGGRVVVVVVIVVVTTSGR